MSDSQQTSQDRTATPVVVAEFIEQFGLTAEADGLPRTAGRIFGLMIILGGPFSFSELAERLQVSRGSISTNTRLLEDMRVISRMTRPGERQDYFRLAKDPYQQFFERLGERSRRTQELVDETNASLPQGWDEARERLDGLSGFYRRLREICDDVATETGERR